MKHFILAILLFLPFLGFTQLSKSDIRKQKNAERQAHIKKLIKQEEEGQLIFDKQEIFGIKLNTDGYGLFYEHGVFKTVNRTDVWWAELGERRDPKEEKLVSQIYDPTTGQQGNPFIYGKIQNFYYLKAGIARQYMLGGKGNNNGVAVSALIGGGCTLALLKPYYLKVVDGNNNLSVVKYNNKNDTVFLGNGIVGAADFGTGYGEMKLIPGVEARAALRFDYGRYNQTVTALEVGLNAEYYDKKINIMAYNKKKDFYFNAYVSIVFGSRK